MVQIDATPTTQEECLLLVRSMNQEVEDMKAQMKNAEKAFENLSAELTASKKMVGVLEEKLLTEKQYERRNILESKAIQGIETLSDSKGYRMWNRKLKNVLEQCRRPARKILLWLDTVTEQAVNDEHDAVCEPMSPKLGILAPTKTEQSPAKSSTR